MTSCHDQRACPTPTSLRSVRPAALERRRDYVERIVVAPDFVTGIEIVRRTAGLAEDMDHHPDIDIRWRRVRFGLTTHDARGVTELDLALARRIDAIATEFNAE